MTTDLIREYVNEIILLEKRKKRKSKRKTKQRKKKRPGKSGYYKGTKKSNASMAKEIDKCSKEPRPKSCYDYWSADKEYDKSKKGKRKK